MREIFDFRAKVLADSNMLGGMVMVRINCKHKDKECNVVKTFPSDHVIFHSMWDYVAKVMLEDMRKAFVDDFKKQWLEVKEETSDTFSSERSDSLVDETE